MFSNRNRTICELHFKRQPDGILVLLEQYKGVDFQFNDKLVKTVELGHYTHVQVHRFYKPLCLRADGYRGELTPAFIEELKALIQEHL